MAMQTLTFTGPDGATATVGTTGFTSLVVTGGTNSMETSWAPGTTAASMRSVGTVTSGAAYGSKSVTSTDSIAVDLDFNPVTFPSAETGILQLMAATSRCFVVGWMPSTGVVRVRDAAFGFVWDSAAGVLSLGTPVRISTFVTRNATTGTIRVVVYQADGTTVLADSGTFTARNTGAASIDSFRLGSKPGTSTATSEMLVGQVRWDPAATALLPSPYAAAAPPTYRWSGSAYVPLDAYRWSGSAYVALETATP